MGKAEKWRLMICGASCAAVALLRINMAGLWVVMCLGVVADCAPKKRIAEIFYDAFWFLLGFLVLALPILLWLYANNAFDTFIQDYFLFNFAYMSGTTERASIKMKAKAFFSTLQRPYILFSLGALFYRYIVHRKFRDILCLLSVVLNVFLICLSGQTYPHYYMIAIPIAVYAVLSIFIEFAAIAERKRRRGAFLAVLLVCAAISAEYWASALYWMSQPLSSDAQIAGIVRENSSEDDFITVCGNMDGVYLLSDRQSVSKYSYQIPVCFIKGSEKSAEMREEYFHDVETRSPKIIVLPSDYPGYARMKEIATRNYQLLDTVSGAEIYALSS